MPLITGHGLGKYYGAHDVFRNVAFSIEEGDRIGLVGPNGEGKTTLLRLLAGIEEPTAGSLDRKRGLRVGYLPQDPPLLADTSLWQFLLEVFASVRAMEGELHQLAQQLAAAPHDQALLERYSALQADFEHRDGYVYEHRIRSVLTGLALDESHYPLALAQLSGGQRTRALLARLLLEEPDLLLLDEPTNHLDLAAVEWLEAWLQGYRGSLLVVSHDRYFLDAVTGRTWEMAFKALETFRGAYTHYVRQRDERYTQRLKQWEAQQEFIAETEDFIRRYLAGQRSREAQGRRTRLERFLRDEAIARPQLPEHIRVRLNSTRRSGDIVCQFRHLAVGYDPARPILELPEIEVRRGQRIAIVGPNGAGKTTLVRSLLGDLPPLAGEVRLGANVEIGYLSQGHDYFDPAMPALDALLQVKRGMTAEQGRTLLGSFLFRGDDVFKPIAALSGGQRSRIALARLAVQEANLLVLDEPTNHLDIASQEILQEVLQAFDGTLILVSHDRYLVQGLANRMWVVDGGRLHCLDGGWQEYLAWRSEGTPAVAERQAREDRQAQREAQKGARRARKETERLLRRQEEIEQSIQVQETARTRLSEQIGKAGEAQDMGQVHALAAEYRNAERALEHLWQEWEGLAAALETDGAAPPSDP